MEMINRRISPKKRGPREEETIITVPILAGEDLDLTDIIERVADFIGDGVLEINEPSKPREYCEREERFFDSEPLFRVSHPLFNGKVPGIEKVIYNKPATIIFWKDGTKTIVKCSKKDIYDPEIGFEKAILTKMFGRAGLRHLYNAYAAPTIEEDDDKESAKSATGKISKGKTKKSTPEDAKKKGE